MTPSTSSPHTQPDPSKTPDPRVAGVRLIARIIARALKRKVADQQPYVGDLLHRLCINVVDLNFETGVPDQGHAAFIRPMPAAKVKQYLQISQPWEIDDDFEPRNLTTTVGDNNMQAAQRLLWFLHSWLNRPHATALLRRTKWRFDYDGHQIRMLNRKIYDKNQGWVVWDLLRYFSSCLEGTASADATQWDTSQPHLTCVVQDDSPLDPNDISSSELCAVVWLSVKNGALTMYKAHAIFPVTVISISGSEVRVVQGNVNLLKGSICLYRSRIVSFQGGPWINGEDNGRQVDPNLLCLLGWFVGEPIGDTLLPASI